MRKFFLCHNNLTEKDEIKTMTTSLFGRTLSIQSSSMNEIKNIIQQLYNNLVSAKEVANQNQIIDDLCKTELLVSNLYYSFFASPLELPDKSETKTTLKNYILQSLDQAKNLIEKINIPEENRIAGIIYFNLQNILNSVSNSPAINKE